MGVSRASTGPRWIRRAALVLCAGACQGPPPPSRPTLEINLPAQGAVLEGDPVAAQALYHSEQQTIALVRVEGPIPVHRHLHSEETVYVLAGEGIVHFADHERRVKAGDLVVVPRNTRHGFTPIGEEPAIVLSIFTPEFQEGDRIYDPGESEAQESSSPRGPPG